MGTKAILKHNTVTIRTVVTVRIHCCSDGNSSLLQQEKMTLLGHNNDLTSHDHNNDLGYDCCRCYSSQLRVTNVHSSSKAWLSKKYPVHVMACIVA